VVKVPLVDLKRSHAAIRDQLHAAVTQVVDDAAYILGPNVAKFEEEVSRWLGMRYAVGVSNGTDALRIALETMRRLRGGGAVITTPYTFFATAETIAAAGLEVVFADVDPDTCGISVQHVAELMDGRGAVGVVPVHLFGQCAEMDPLLDLAREKNAFVIEDVAQAFGARYKGRMAGTMGDMSCFSFFPSKNLGGIGDGGLVCTGNEDLAKEVRSARAHGSAGKKYHHAFLSGNYRLDEIQAAALRVKLRRVEEWNRERVRLARDYDRLLADAGLLTSGGIRLFSITPGSDHVYHQYVVRAERRDALAEHLTANGIGNAIYYAVPLHRQKAFEHLGYKPEDFPAAMSLSRTCIALPIFPGLTAEEQQCVVDRISAFYAGGAA